MKTIIILSLLMVGCIVEPRPEDVINDKPLQGTWISLDGTKGIVLNDTYNVLLEKDTVYITYHVESNNTLYCMKEYNDTLYIEGDRYIKKGIKIDTN